ncbi:MAG: DUF4190 domain-containing protein [Clostridiales bacterium]|nr:DUF4190 domain-containing protein [Clostridiales bacterium]
MSDYDNKQDSYSGWNDSQNSSGSSGGYGYNDSQYNNGYGNFEGNSGYGDGGRKGRPFAIAAFVVGILSILGAVTGAAGVLIGMAGVALAVLSRKWSPLRGKAKTGLILSIIGIALSIFVLTGRTYLSSGLFNGFWQSPIDYFNEYSDGNSYGDSDGYYYDEPYDYYDYGDEYGGYDNGYRHDYDHEDEWEYHDFGGGQDFYGDDSRMQEGSPDNSNGQSYSM